MFTTIRSSGGLHPSPYPRVKWPDSHGWVGALEVSMGLARREGKRVFARETSRMKGLGGEIQRGHRPGGSVRLEFSLCARVPV